MIGKFFPRGTNTIFINSEIFYRFSWLYKCMLDDEIEKTILAKKEKLEPLLIGSSSVSSS